MVEIKDCPDKTEVTVQMTHLGKRYIASNSELNNTEYSGRCAEIAMYKLLKDWNIKEFEMKIKATNFNVDSLDIKCLKLFIIEFFNNDQKGYKIKTNQDVMFYELAHDLYNHLLDVEETFSQGSKIALTPAYLIVIKKIHETTTGKIPAIVEFIIHETPVKLKKLK